MLTLRLQTPDDPEPAWASHGSNGQAAPWVHGTWERLLPLAQSQRQGLVLLIPTREVLLLPADAKTRNSRQLQQAVPYALEDQLAGELEEQHIVWQLRPDSTVVDAAIIQRDRLRAWLDALRARQLNPQAILPDVFALPWEDGGLTLWQHGEQVWLRTGARSGYAITQDALPLVLAHLTQGHTDPIPLRLYTDQPAAWADDARFQIIPEPHPDHLLPSSLQPALGLNLLQGWQDGNNTAWRQRWRLAAGLAGAAVLLGIGNYAVDTYHLNRQLAAQDQANLQLFAELFPEAQNVDPRSLGSRMASELVRLGGQGSTAQAPNTLEQLTAFATLAAQTGGLTLEEIRAQPPQLAISLQAQDQQTVDNLRTRLEQDLGKPVGLQATRTANNVKATLTLGEEP